MSEVKFTLDEALKFYGLTEQHLLVRERDANDKPVYAVRITRDRVVFVLSSGPKLMYPPVTRDHCGFAPKKRRKLALKLAGLLEAEPADEEDDDISPADSPHGKQPGARSAGRR